MLSVVHCWLSPGPLGGGAGIAMRRLHEGLLAAGVRSRVLCRLNAPPATPEIEVVPRWARLERALFRLTRRLGLNDIHRVSSPLIVRHPFYRDADVVHFHGLHSGFLSYLSLPALTRRKPAVLTLHDLWALTGHCASPQDCQRWRTGCRQCPYPDTHPAVLRDATHIEWTLKKWAYARSRLTIVALSEAHAELARQGLLGRFPIQPIPNGIDTALFRPQDRRRCRAALGVPQDRLVVMCAALALDQVAKGGDLLVAALQHLPEPVRRNLTLLLAGGGGGAIRDALAIPSIDLGLVTEPETMAAAYAAADLFVLPSRAETFSLVLAEALACGTPLVAFDVGGGVPGLVRPGVTGYLARAEDPQDLARGMAAVLADAAQRRELARNCRALALADYSASAQIARHIALYERLKAENAAPLAAAAAPNIPADHRRAA